MLCNKQLNKAVKKYTEWLLLSASLVKKSPINLYKFYPITHKFIIPQLKALPLKPQCYPQMKSNCGTWALHEIFSIYSLAVPPSHMWFCKFNSLCYVSSLSKLLLLPTCYWLIQIYCSKYSLNFTSSVRFYLDFADRIKHYSILFMFITFLKSYANAA